MHRQQERLSLQRLRLPLVDFSARNLPKRQRLVMHRLPQLLPPLGLYKLPL